MDKVHALIFIMIFCLGCSASQSKVGQSTDANIWQVEAQAAYGSDEAVNVLMRNTSDQSLTIIDPLLKFIEHQNDGSWNKINTLYCGCGGCPPPPETLDVAPGESYSFSWDQQEETCINGKLDRKSSKKGQYRLVISYYTNPREVQKLYVPFEL